MKEWTNEDLEALKRWARACGVSSEVLVDAIKDIQLVPSQGLSKEEIERLKIASAPQLPRVSGNRKERRAEAARRWRAK